MGPILCLSPSLQLILKASPKQMDKIQKVLEALVEVEFAPRQHDLIHLSTSRIHGPVDQATGGGALALMDQSSGGGDEKDERMESSDSDVDSIDTDYWEDLAGKKKIKEAASDDEDWAKEVPFIINILALIHITRLADKGEASVQHML